MIILFIFIKPFRPAGCRVPLWGSFRAPLGLFYFLTLSCNEYFVFIFVHFLVYIFDHFVYIFIYILIYIFIFVHFLLSFFYIFIFISFIILFRLFELFIKLRIQALKLCFKTKRNITKFYISNFKLSFHNHFV